MPSHSETAWMQRPVARPATAARRPLLPRLTGFLVFGGLVLGALIAVRDGCAERQPSEAGSSSLSTLAPIMRPGRGAPPDAAAKGTGCKNRTQSGRSAKLKPTP